MKSEIILGSANFVQTYGVNKNLIKKKEIIKLLNIASKNKIRKIDTAPSYNDSEKIIGTLNNILNDVANHFQISKDELITLLWD